MFWGGLGAPHVFFFVFFFLLLLCVCGVRGGGWGRFGVWENHSVKTSGFGTPRCCANPSYRRFYVSRNLTFMGGMLMASFSHEVRKAKWNKDVPFACLLFIQFILINAIYRTPQPDFLFRTSCGFASLARDVRQDRLKLTRLWPHTQVVWLVFKGLWWG